MRLINLSIIIAISLLFNCSGKQKTVYQAPVFPNQEEIHFEIINDSFLVKGVSYMAICDSLLIMYSPSITPFVNIFNKETGVLLKSAGTTGQGPEELVNPCACSFDRKNKILYVFDAGKRSVFGFNITNIVQNTQPVLEQKRIWEQESIITNIYHLKDSLFIANGRIEELIVSTTHESGYRKTYMPDVPDGITPDEWKSLLSRPTNTIKPDGSKYVSTSIIGGILDIYSIDNQGIKLETRKNFYEPVYGLEPGLGAVMVTFIDETIFGFYSLSSTDSFLYAVVYGKVKPTEHSKLIWKFDWNGNPIITYNSNYGIEQFVADEQSQQIYAFVYNTDGEIALAKGKMRH
jgi:hypothetical protein